MTLRELDDRTERATVIRALLAQPFLDSRDPAYALLRRHEREIARELQTTFGYQLQIGSTAARASGPPTPAGRERPIRVLPGSATGRRRAPDEWAALSDRAGLILLLTLAALERSGAQTAIAELARDVERAAADVDPPVEVDFNSRRERVAFADGLDLLCDWGVLGHESGSHQSYARQDQGDDEALFTIDHRRLALLLEDPAAALAATSLQQLCDDSGRYAPTPEAENRARFERIARRLTEDPVLLLAELNEDEQAYFLGQRARIEDAVAETTGYVIERRREGSALICDDRDFTDVPFPTNAALKQIALLLCDDLAGCGPDGELSREAIVAGVRRLVVKHGEHWSRDPKDAAEIRALTDAVIEVLLACDLLRRSGPDAFSPTPLAARFRKPVLRTSGATA